MRILFRAALALLMAAAPLQRVRAAAAPPAPREISEKISARLGELRDLTGAKNYPAALSLIDRLFAQAAADSYDTFVLSQVQAQIYLTQDRPALALTPLETSLRLADAHPFLDPKPRLDLVYLLAQVCAQLAGETNDPAAQRDRLGQAYAYVRRWLAETSSPTAEAQLFAASVLYNRAQAAVPPDRAQFAAALTEAEKGLALAAHPDEQFYVLMLASLQQLGDFARAADILELLVAQHPDRSTYWQQLSGTYLNLAAAAKDNRAVRHQQFRALVTIEDAQRQNFLTAPSDQFNLAGLYFNLGQYGRVIALLEPGLTGPLGDKRDAWELLIRACQQLQQDAHALAVLERAVVRFPDDSRFVPALREMRQSVARPSP